MTPIILYALPVSGYSAKIRITLEAKRVAYEERVPPGGYRSDAYRAIVPMGTIPAILVGEVALSESEVIAEYLDERFPDPPLLPADPMLRAQVRFLSRFHDLYLEPAVRGLFGQVNPHKRDPALVQARAQDIDRQLARLDTFINPQPYALTEQLSLADLGFVTTLPLARMLLAVTGHTLVLAPRIERWLDAVGQHPAIARGLAPWHPGTDAWIAGQLAASA